MPVLLSFLTVEIQVDSLLSKNFAYQLKAKVAFVHLCFDVLVTFNENLFTSLFLILCLLMFLFLKLFLFCLDSLDALKCIESVAGDIVRKIWMIIIDPESRFVNDQWILIHWQNPFTLQHYLRHCLFLIHIIERVMLQLLCVHPDQRVVLGDLCLNATTLFHFH